MARTLKKTRIELKNAGFSLPDLVARAESYFEQEGLDVELVHNYPEPYSPAEFQRTYDFMVAWGLINPARTYDKLVDARVTA